MEKEKKIGILGRFVLERPEEERKRILIKGVENILAYSKYEAPPEVWSQVKLLAQEGFTFEIVANHTSHADAYVAAKVGADLASFVNYYAPDENKIKGFVMPFAQSMLLGTQNSLLTTFFNDTMPIFEKYKVEPVYTATEGDIKKKRVEGRNRTAFSRQMIQGVKEGKAVIIFPEGRVEGGRRNEFGNIKGMQEFTKDAVQQSLRVATSVKDKVAVIPAAISGGYNVYNPHNEKFTWDAFLVGYGLSKKSLFHVKIGMPLLFDKTTIRKMDSERIDKIVASAIAKLLPAAERGSFYSS